MSQPPATPNKPIEGASKLTSKVAVPSIDKILSASKVKQVSLYEPSPASTYGDTANGDSVPATPLESHGHDNTATLIHSLRGIHLEDPSEGASGSPIQVHEAKLRSQSERLADAVHGASLGETQHASPSKAGSIGNLSPNDSCLKKTAESPSWRRGEAFIRQSQHQTDDPFVTSANAVQAPSQVSVATFHPRGDRIGLELSPDTAQAILPPNACVFVANLSQTKSDEQLEYSVTAVFQAFGNVYVKIRRDGKGMPFAFCQYENVADAQRAITMGRGMAIDGRPCRTEVAKVNRSLYLSRVTGGFVSEAEARQVLTRFGALEKVWYCSQTDREMFRLPEGIWVMFAFFQDCRDAQSGFRDDKSYRLEQPRMPDDIRARLGSRVSYQSPLSPLRRLTQAHTYVSPQSALRRAQDSCSIFVGNLPATADEQSLNEVFGANGQVHKIEIVRKAAVNATGVNNFAFIEFFSQEEAARVAKGTYTLFGVRLRVERKETIEPSPRPDIFISSGESPRNRHLSDNEVIALVYQRGLSEGMATAVSPPAPTVHPSSFAQYPYFQPLNTQSAYGYIDPALGVNTDGLANLQIHGNAYLPQAMGNQFQFTQGMAPYTLAQFPIQQNNYQWPLSNANNELNTTASGVVGEDTR